MTELVINVVAMDSHVKSALKKWPSRSDVLADAQEHFPALDLWAVHRWFQRSSVPAKYWSALASGATVRGLKVSIGDLALAHSKDSCRAAVEKVSGGDAA
jgi:hypothetical protein